MTPVVDRYQSLRILHGEENLAKIQNTKILIIGAGGIGCEILKNLALLGIKKIEVIDLDTIDVSNLNRQFLFRPEHVGQSKAIVAAKATEAFNPDVKVIAHHDNVKNTIYNIDYFASFDLVLNALDNIDARRHVNRLCLAAKVPLFDSGTTGYLGQVVPIIKGFTACYECYPKPTPKVYPICTIRSTPDKPVHCIVWAKECLKLLFGNKSESMLFEDESTGEKSEYMHLLNFPLTDLSLDNILSFSKDLLVGLFNKEITKRIEMNVYKTAKITPEALSLEAIEVGITLARDVLANGFSKPSSGNVWDHKIWSIGENIVEFVDAIHHILVNDQELLGKASFDKDDIWAMKFVAACSNLRSHIFSIPLQSFYSAKGIAGNIIPAIATTNAIVSGIQVAHALKYILHFTKSEIYECSNEPEARENLIKKIQTHFPYTYCLRYPTRKGLYLQPTACDEPVSSCYVCSSVEVTLYIDTAETTFEHLLTKIIKGKLGFNQPSIYKESSILYEEGEDVEEEDYIDTLPKKLVELPAGGIVDQSSLKVDDFTQNLEVTLIIKHMSNADLEKIESAKDEMHILQRPNELVPKPTVTEQTAQATTTSSDQVASSDDVVIVMDDVQVIDAPESNKRSHEDIESTEPSAKRVKL